MDTAGTIAAETTSPYALPDWANIHKELACPLCAYNLRGLIEPRCPECGYSFAWPDLLDPARQKHPYLYEQHSERGFRAFFQTAFHAMRPLKFWKMVKPEHACNGRRLIRYLTATSLLLILSSLSVIAFAVADFNARRWGTWNYTGVVWSSFGRTLPPAPLYPVEFTWPPFDLKPLIVFYGSLVLWPLLSFAALHLLRASMGQAKIRSVHVLRCIAYSWDTAAWVALITTFVNVACASVMIGAHINTIPPSTYETPMWLVTGPSLLWLLVIPIFVYRMAIAYRRYLRFRHAVASVLLTQAIVFLFFLSIALFVASDFIVDQMRLWR